MKATIDGVTYEGAEDEIRRIIENPPLRPPIEIRYWPNGVYPKNWDGTPELTCQAGGKR